MKSLQDTNTTTSKKTRKSFRGSLEKSEPSVKTESDPSKVHAAIGLNKTLADSYALLIKTHNYHWNATGPGFIGFHNLCEQEYNLLFSAIDEIAEILRTTGQKVPASLKHFSQLSDIEEPDSTLSLKGMAQDLAESNTHISDEIKVLIPYFEDNKQYDIVDFLVARIAAHNKAAWLYRSSVDA